jgi:AcrR family transcriptional regulator
MSAIQQPSATLSDRRAVRSRRALWAALLALLQDNDWAEISVQMICDHADVARSTFYAHFQTKQDLLDAGFALGAAEVAAEMAALPIDPERLAVLEWLVDHAARSQGFMRRVRGSAAGQVIMARFQAMIAQLLAQANGFALGRRGPVSDADLVFVTGGVFASIEAWLASGARDPRKLVLRLRGQIDVVLRG